MAATSTSSASSCGCTGMKIPGSSTTNTRSRAGTCSFTGTAAASSNAEAGLVEVDFQKELRRVRNLPEEGQLEMATSLEAPIGAKEGKSTKAQESAVAPDRAGERPLFCRQTLPQSGGATTRTGGSKRSGRIGRGVQDRRQSVSAQRIHGNAEDRKRPRDARKGANRGCESTGFYRQRKLM